MAVIDAPAHILINPGPAREQIQKETTTPEAGLSFSFAGATHRFARPEDQAFYESLERMSLLNILNPVKKEVESVEKEPHFNGHTLPQPAFVNEGSEITIDFYSERAECVVERFGVEIAEKLLDCGSPSERFGVFHGFPSGVPQDCFEGEDKRALVFVLVDKFAMEHGFPSCLAQVRVASDGESFSVVPYEHPHGYGELVAEAMVKEALDMAAGA